MSESRGLVRWGLLSTARINERLIPLMVESDRSQLCAVASRDAGRAQSYAGKWQIPRSHGSYSELVEDPEIDAIYISVPNSKHAEWTIKGAEAGKHILCEKPLALTAADVDSMAAAARANGVVLQEGAMYRYHPQTERVRDMVKSDVIGQVRLIQCSFGFSLGRDSDVRLQPELGGGSLWDIGSYPVSLSRAVLGEEPVDVVSWQVLGTEGVDLSFGGQLRFSSGAIAQFSCSFATLSHWGALFSW